MRLPVDSSVCLDVKTTDRYGRTVAEVITGTNIGLALVEDGQAFAYRRHLDQCNAREYLQAEFRASRRRHGIWQEPGGITRPWDFRRSRRSPRICDGTTPGGSDIISSVMNDTPWKLIQQTGWKDTRACSHDHPERDPLPGGSDPAGGHSAG